MEDAVVPVARSFRKFWVVANGIRRRLQDPVLPWLGILRHEEDMADAFTANFVDKLIEAGCVRQVGDGIRLDAVAVAAADVVKLYTALQLDNQQVAYYHPEVGTLGDPTKKGMARKWSVVKGLAFGSGFQDNVLDAYRYLMQHYADGDRVYILGFSRGAYTVRRWSGCCMDTGCFAEGTRVISHMRRECISRGQRPRKS